MNRKKLTSPDLLLIRSINVILTYQGCETRLKKENSTGE